MSAWKTHQMSHQETRVAGCFYCEPTPASARRFINYQPPGFVNRKSLRHSIEHGNWVHIRSLRARMWREMWKRRAA